MKIEDVKVDVQSRGKFGEEIAIRMTYKDKNVFAIVPQRDHSKAIKYLLEKLERMNDYDPEQSL